MEEIRADPGEASGLYLPAAPENQTEQVRLDALSAIVRERIRQILT